MEIDKPTLVARIGDILRNDLKLGDVDIDENTALAGGDFDLDSLDLLLIVTTVEKTFGIKIPNEDVGRDAFESVGTLADYIATQAA